MALTAAGLAFVRWAEDAHLYVLGVLSFGSAHLGRMALRKRWSNWSYFHVSGMGASYISPAFYVDNGKNLPLWRDLPQIAFWLLPSAIGILSTGGHGTVPKEQKTQQSPGLGLSRCPLLLQS